MGRVFLGIFGAVALLLSLFVGFLRLQPAPHLPPAGIIFKGTDGIYQADWFGKHLHKLDIGAWEQVWSPVLLPNGNLLFSAEENGRYVLLEQRGAEQVTLLSQNIFFEQVYSTPDGIFWVSIREPFGIYSLVGENFTRLRASYVLDVVWQNGFLYFSENVGGINRDLFRMRADGTGLENLTPHPSYNAQVQVSPDGSTLYFVTNRTGNFEIFRLRIAEQELTNLTQSHETDNTPILSPDGKTLVYVAYGQNETEIYRMDVATLEKENLTEHPNQDEIPSISPDGGWIVFASSRGGGFGLYRMDMDGEHLQILTPNQLAYDERVDFLPPRQGKFYGLSGGLGALCLYIGMKRRKVLP